MIFSFYIDHDHPINICIFICILKCSWYTFAAGKLPKSNGIPWRGDSGLADGNDTTLNKKLGLVGGYYDAGDNVKFNFPMAYTMTMLSWSVIEYSHKYESIGEYKHVRELIKWGTDYLLLTFNSSSTKISEIYCQVLVLVIYSLLNYLNMAPFFSFRG